MSEERKKNYLTYGSIISFMLDYTESNEYSTISYEPQNWKEINQKNKENFIDFFTSRSYLFSHGEFNEHRYFHQFENKQDIKSNYLNTLFLVLPAFEMDSLDELNKLIKTIKSSGISESSEFGVSKHQIIDTYIRFKQEIQTNHDKSLKLMKKENNTVNYNDCVLFLHLKSGKFLEYKYNNKNLKTYIQLSNNMSKRTLFRFLPAYDYQSETSTFCLFNLAIQIACGEKNAIKDKFLANDNIRNFEKNPFLRKSIIEERKNSSDEEENEDKNNIIQKEKKSIFDPDNLKCTIQAIYNEEPEDSKVIDEFVEYSMNENLQQKNLGVKLMPEKNYVIADCTSFNFWKIINFSEDYFDDIQYLNLLDFFCIQNPDKNLFIHLKEIDNEELNNTLLNDNSNIINITKNKFDVKISKENKMILPSNKNLGYISSKNNINDTTIKFFNDRIEVNYFLETNTFSNKKHELIVDTYEDKEHLKPYSLFKIDPLYDFFEEKDINCQTINNMNIVLENNKVRLINIFTNKVLCVDKIFNKYILFLVENMRKGEKYYDNTIFIIEQIKDNQEIEENEEKSENDSDNNTEEEEKNENSENSEKNETYLRIKKKSYIKLYSQKFSAYIGIRIRNENNNKELVLTNSMSDITRFQFNCLDEEDKYELNFFEQLLLSFINILNYFKHENKTITILSQNYERIKHILLTLKSKLNQIQSHCRDVNKLNLQENKFDFVEIVGHFNIASKLIELFLTNWFRDYQGKSYKKLDEFIMKEYFQDNKDILKYKLLISREILDILTIIYDLNPCYLNVIEENLLCFFVFVGRDDKCTKFLNHILKNNKLLLISLCPLSKENIEIKEEAIENEQNINEINSITNISDNEEILKRKNDFKKLKFINLKKCLSRIVKDYNNMTKDQLRINFSSLVLFFNLMNNLLIFDNKPFRHFYNDYFKDLGLLKPIEGGKLKPNFEKNPMLIDFYINNENEIYIKKMSFPDKKNEENRKLTDVKLNALIDIISNYNYDTEEERNNILFAKLVSVNLFFYSFLSLCDSQFKSYMENTFKFDILINDYLKFTYNVIDKTYDNNILNENEEKNNNIITNVPKLKRENPLMNDLKCSVIQVLTYLYLKVPYPFMIKTHLFKIINSSKNTEISTVNKSELKKLIHYIDNIINNNEEKIEIKLIDQYCLIQTLELIKYTLRNLYLMNNTLDETDRNNIYNLNTNVINLLEKFIGLPKKEDIQFDNDESILNSIEGIINDKLELRDPIFLISENFHYVFLKYKNRLSNAIRKKNERGNNTKAFLDILSDICDQDRIQKNKYDMGMAELTKKNIKILKKFNLKGVLMDVSINTNRNKENITIFTLLTMLEILNEFMEYLEYSTIEALGENSKLNEILTRKEYEDNLKKELITSKSSTKYLDEFIKKKIDYDEFPISLYFFKILYHVKNTKLQNLALEIIYKLNNSKKIFYFNMSNLVIMESQEEFSKFLEIKNIFIEIIETVKHLNVIQRLDQNSINLCNFLNENIQKLLEKLFDEDKWNNENNALNVDEDYKFEDSIGIQKESNEDSIIYSQKASKIDEEDDDKESENQSKSDKEDEKKNSKENQNDIKNENSLLKSKNNTSENKSQIFSFDSKKSGEIIDSSSKDKDKDKTKDKNKNLLNLKSKDLDSIKTEGNYFLNDYDDENLVIYQQTLYNLGFISFINDFFSYIDKLSETKSELTGDLLCLEESLISIYKMLVVFFANNEKLQSIIKNKLYLYICPLKIKKISSSLLYSLNYFLFHLVYNFESIKDYGKISNIDVVIDRLYLLHQLDWNLHKNVMPYFVRTLLIFFEYTTPEYIYLIFQLLDDIKNIVTTDILNGNNKNNNILILTKLLEFTEIELLKKEFKEYRNRPLLSMANVIKAFPIMIELLTPKNRYDKNNFKFAKPLILITNLLFDFYDPYYKNDFDSNKNIILNSILTFCSKMTLKDEFIFKNTNRSISIKYFNEFMGLSLPKLYILLRFSGTSDSSVEIIEKVNQFYEKIYHILLFNEEEDIFLEEKHEEEIETIFAGTEDKLKFLDNIIEIKNLNENSSNSLYNTKTVDKDELKKKFKNLRKASTKRIIFDKDLLEKKTLLQNYNKEINNQFKEIAENEIKEERKNFIIKLFSFFNLINENNSISFFVDYCRNFTKLYQNSLIKNQYFFFYWTNIYLMHFTQKEQKEKCFDEKNSKYNKDYFNDLSLIEFTIERFENINLNYNNYENLLYIKFLNSYLNGLDEENRAKFLTILIEKPESTKLFHLMHNILDNLFLEIQNDFKENNSKIDNIFNRCPASVFEPNISEYEIILKFLVNLCENNDIIKNKMKDYLRLQYNNIKNHNFITILSNILESFLIENNKKFIPKHYSTIITIIEFITKCCYGPSKDNQDCVVKKTHILDFSKIILKYVNYREKKYNDDGISLPEYKDKIREEENENEPNTSRTFHVFPDERRKLSYLKYKLLILLNVLTIGRKKGDKIYDLIHQIIDFEVLASLLIETFKEILIEKNAQLSPKNFTFEENMLSRMNDLKSYLESDEKFVGKNFIIFEIGTYAYILINTYLENLTRPLDLDTYNRILDIKQKLQKNKCEVKSNSIFKNLIDFIKNLVVCYKLILNKICNWYKQEINDGDFILYNSFYEAYSFYFEYTPNIEILYNDKIYKYYIRLSPICKCLTKEMKDDFHSSLDRSSAKTKTENLFNRVESFRYQLIMNKKILDAFSTAPILNLFFNHYKFYRDVFLILAIILNLLIFMSFYRTKDEKPYDFDYGFLYKRNNITTTRLVFFVFTIFELIFAFLILVNYLIFRVSYLLYFKGNNQESEEKEEEKDEEEEKDKITRLNNLAKNGEILKYIFERMGNVLLNIIKDIKLIYHLILLAVIISTLILTKYKILSILLIDIIERSSTLMCIVKSFWIPKKQILAILLLFYLVAYYFIILIYLFIPDDLPGRDCFKFSNCYFTLCDQTIKNSNGIINYLTKDGLYTFSSLWGNPRFWIDNWFAIFDLILVIQMFCGIIIDTFLSQREKNKDIEKDKNNKCFICDLDKNELNKYYTSENGYNEHIKLDHYLWTYMFAIFNVTLGDESNYAFLDIAIKEGYETKKYSKWVPYKKCLNQLESEINLKKKQK